MHTKRLVNAHVRLEIEPASEQQLQQMIMKSGPGGRFAIAEMDEHGKPVQ